MKLTVITKENTTEEQLYFGGIERGSGRCFIEAVEFKNAETLLPIIQKHIFSDSIIILDFWRAYGFIKKLLEGYTHFTVNHTKKFLNPENGAALT